MRRSQKRMRKRTVVTLLAVVLVAIATACGDGAAPQVLPGTSVDVAANLLQNGSFEVDPDPWFSLTTPAWGKPFSVSSHVAHSGEQSAHLELRAPIDASGAEVVGVVQEASPEEFPEMLSGYYYVDDWLKGARKQYLQFVVIAFGVTNLPGGHVNHQIRFPLAGIDDEPFAITNAKFLFLSREEPVIGQWVYFERPVGQDFRELWGAVPEGFERLRILFEVRYD
ncbi:unnamed protein product, partial [marine sediment metagenome]